MYVYLVAGLIRTGEQPTFAERAWMGSNVLSFFARRTQLEIRSPAWFLQV
jgi:hypothetical protein